MAKRKGKRSKKSKLSLILGLSTIILALMSLVLFLSLDTVMLYISDKAIEETAFNGFRLAFGYKETNSILGTTVTVTYLNPSIVIILGLALVVIGGLLVLPKKKLFNLLGGIMLIAAAVIFILSGKLTSLTDDLKKFYEIVGSVVNSTYKPIIGAYLGALLSGLAGFTGIFKAVFGK